MFFKKRRMRRHCLALIEKGASADELLAYLRDQGQSKLQSIMMLRDTLQLPLAKAQELVECSPVWSMKPHKSS